VIPHEQESVLCGRPTAADVVIWRKGRGHCPCAAGRAHLVHDQAGAQRAGI
jgi:hypothetical protein